jgi:hypothetical protein
LELEDGEEGFFIVMQLDIAKTCGIHLGDCISLSVCTLQSVANGYSNKENKEKRRYLS